MQYKVRLLLKHSQLKHDINNERCAIFSVFLIYQYAG